MPEAKSVQEVKQLEERLAAARETARAAFITTINDAVEQLKAIGYEYHVAQNGAAPAAKRGRPKKEAGDGQSSS